MSINDIANSHAQWVLLDAEWIILDNRTSELHGLLDLLEGTPVEIELATELNYIHARMVRIEEGLALLNAGLPL